MGLMVESLSFFLKTALTSSAPHSDSPNMSRFIRISYITFFGLAVIGQLVLPNFIVLASRPAAIVMPQGKSSITGIVFDPSGKPLEKVRVELMDDVYSVLKTFRTTGTGQFAFRGLSPGVFNVRVIVESGEYAEQIQRVELISLNRGDAGLSRDIRQVDFYLRPKNTGKPMTGAAVVFSQNVPEDAKKRYSKAVDDFEKNKSKEGIEGLKAALQVFPDYYLALIKLGEEQINLAQFEEARALLARAVKVNSRGYEGFYWLGIAQVGLKRLPEAIESFRQALLQNPSSINSTLWLGMALRRNGQLDEAEKQLNLAKRLAPKPIPQIHWEMALLYNHQKRNREAADELELFLKAQPDSRDAEAIKKLIKQLREKKEKNH
jgi:thioredoxin-like negative regulator of GroEL